MEERFEKRGVDIYFPFEVKLSGLDSQEEWLQKEVKAIQKQLASQHEISASIDRAHSKSIDSTAPATIDRHLVASIDTTSTPDDEQLIQNKMESMHEELNELSAYAYDKIGWHQFSIEDILERLHNISNAIQKMDERWTRNYEATRSFIAAWSRMCRDEVDACFPTIHNPILPFPEDLCIVRNLLLGGLLFWGHFSPERVRAAVETHRYRFRSSIDSDMGVFFEDTPSSAVYATGQSSGRRLLDAEDDEEPTVEDSAFDG
uniref:Uncharacterized protein n=1 Tax=Brassica campestris TaxID=3711 RepID=M4FJ11_BRACM